MKIIGKKTDLLSVLNGDTQEKDITTIFEKEKINLENVQVGRIYYCIHYGQSFMVTKIEQ